MDKERQSRIDDAILSALAGTQNWTKVAMTIARSVRALEGTFPEDPEIYDSVGNRIEALVNDGALLAKGNVRNWRFSEIKRADK